MANRICRIAGRFLRRVVSGLTIALHLTRSGTVGQHSRQMIAICVGGRSERVRHIDVVVSRGDLYDAFVRRYDCLRRCG